MRDGGAPPPAHWRGAVYGAVAATVNDPPAPQGLERLEGAARACRDAGETELAAEIEQCIAAARCEGPAALRQDFEDLFRVPTGRYVTPYESVYADPAVVAGGRTQACTFGASTAAVERFYRRVGLELAAGFAELPDHAGAEAACMEYLCVREAEYLAAGQGHEAAAVRAAQAAFVREHVSRWFPALCARVVENAATDFYRSLARATEVFVRGEAARFTPVA